MMKVYANLTIGVFGLLVAELGWSNSRLVATPDDSSPSNRIEFSLGQMGADQGRNMNWGIDLSGRRQDFQIGLKYHRQISPRWDIGMSTNYSKFSSDDYYSEQLQLLWSPRYYFNLGEFRNTSNAFYVSPLSGLSVRKKIEYKLRKLLSERVEVIPTFGLELGKNFRLSERWTYSPSLTILAYTSGDIGYVIRPVQFVYQF